MNSYGESNECVVNSYIALGDIMGIYAAKDICIPQLFVEDYGASFSKAQDLAYMCRETVEYNNVWRWPILDMFGTLFGWVARILTASRDICRTRNHGTLEPTWAARG